MRHQLVLARAGALATATTAVATGLLEATPAVHTAIAELAWSVVSDLWVEVSTS